MPTVHRETTVEVPLDIVWSFHSGIEGLEALTPTWMGLSVERVWRPDGDVDPSHLDVGTRIALSVRPFGVGPRLGWTSEITGRDRTDGSAFFRDEMVVGPVDRWIHTHAFFADGDRTILRDHVDYELPYRPIGNALRPVSRLGIEGFFRDRHRRTKELLEHEAVNRPIET